METKTKSVSVVVPVYNGQETLRELAQRVQTVLDRAGYEHELIFVNDGSRDLSWQVIQDLTLGDRRIRGLDLMRNYG